MVSEVATKFVKQLENAGGRDGVQAVERRACGGGGLVEVAGAGVCKGEQHTVSQC
jgi:hypothetical protein